MASNLPPFTDILRKNLSVLIRKINITYSGLWDQMVSNGVVDFIDVETIKVCTTYYY